MRYVLIKWTSDDDEGTYSMMDASCIVQGLDELAFDKGNPEQDQRTVLVQRQVKWQDQHSCPICTPVTKG